MKHIQKKRLIYLLFLICILAFSSLLAIMIGPVYISPLKIWYILIKTIGISVSNPLSNFEISVIINIRLPRIIVSILVGMGLAVSGASMQGIFRNPMADPYVLGMSAGAGLGASLAIVLGIGKVFGGLGIPIMAFIVSMITIFVVYRISLTGGRIPTETLLLAGIAIGFFLHAIISFLKLIASHEALRDIVLWLMGSFATSIWQDVLLIIFPIGIGLIILLSLSWELNALQLGEETALSIGVEVERIKKIILITCALITSAGVCVAGIIGFVGLIIPHIMRMIIGGDYKVLLPASAIGGGIFLVIADTIARNIIAPEEIPIGIITSFIGAPYFIYLLRRRKKAIAWW